MKAVIGFGVPQEESVLTVPQAETGMVQPVRSLVEVWFPADDRTLTYYNDRFDVKPGDLVFVSGKYAGKTGVVNAVSTKFKVDLAHYKRVIACPTLSLSGTFRPVLGMMVSTEDRTVPDADLFRSWVKPPLPPEQEYELVCGDGYAFDLKDFESDPDVDQTILSRAVDYCKEGKIRFLSLKDGVGTAFVEGTLWYEINFTFRDGKISDMYCDCPYPGLCKHNLAVLLMLRALLNKLPLEAQTRFVAVAQNFFWRIINNSKQQVSV